MDSHNRLDQSESSEDEDNNFARYMDENGVIGMEEEKVLDLDSRELLELEEDEEPKMLGLGEKEMVDEDGLPYADSPSEGDGLGIQSWKEEFSFSQAAEERSHTLMDTETLKNSDNINHYTDDHSSVEHPSTSITLPSALNRRPPSRDQQLDMTEDEVDRGSSLGAWDGDEDKNWNQERSEFLYDESHGHGRFGEYDQTSVGEEEWDNNPGSPEQDYSENRGNQEDEALIESFSQSFPPIPSTWGTKLMSHFGRLNLSPRIEDETLPESSCTESGESPAANPAGNPTNISNLTKVSKQTGTLRTKPTLSPSTPLRIQRAEHSSVKKTKRSTTPLYGKGQLNYPLPDFSKVGPRVRFPRDDQAYHPPQPRRVENQKQGVPVIFKSPAEIVKEVLLSSTEKPIQEPLNQNHLPTVPKEFKTPQQATELVHQLQEDYHKLLTKYAEAENTIDRLRLGAKVHLYSDPAQPSHSVQMGTVIQGSKVMEFTIPHPQSATFTSVNEHQGVTEGDSGSSSPPNLVTSPNPTLPDTSGLSSLHPPEDVTSTLMSHLDTLHREVELFEELLQGGNLTRKEQRQAVRELRGSLDVLERRYLKAQEQYRQEQRCMGQPLEELDPQRELEEAIFQLGVQLDELQERIQHSALSSPNTQFKNNSEGTITTHHLGNAPVPSAVVPIPALQTPYPQVSSPEPPGLSGADVRTVNKEDSAEYLPQPVRYKHMQVERDYGTLLSTYSSFKSLPDALGVEQDEWPQQLPQNATPYDHPQDARTQGHLQPVRSQDHTQATRPLDPMTSGRQKDHPQATRPLDSMTSVRPQVHQDHLQAVSPRDHQQALKTKRHSQIANHQNHPTTVTPQSNQPAESFLDNLHDSRPTSGSNVQHTLSPTEKHRTPSVSSAQRTLHSPDEGKYSSVRRMSHGSKTFPQRVSLSSPLPQLREQSSRSPRAVSEQSARSPQSQKSSSSNKSVSPSARKESSRINGNIAQRRILSPETDSGFLGSESGRSLLLQKQRDQLSLNRDNPAELPDSSANSPLKRERGLSKMETDHLSRTRKALWEKRNQNDHWPGPSDATSSPSPGPKSLTESESREQSQTDESDLEQEAFNDVLGGRSSGASPILLPFEELSQPHGNILESRTARDQAIHNLQNEVIQLRQHLENSLNRSPTREILGQSAAIQNLHKGTIPHFDLDLDSPISRRGADRKESGAEYLLGSSVSRARAAQVGRGVQGAYTGTRYKLPGSPPLHRTEQATVPHRQRCQETERKCPVSMETSKDNENVPPIHPDCPLCHGNNEYDTTRTAMCHGEYNRHIWRRPRCSHRILSHSSPVSYIQPPLVPYSPPVIYGTSPSLYVPVEYNVAVTPPPNPDILQLEDLNWPLNQALEAAKGLKITSKRMCQSLTMDLSIQRNLRGSCLF